MGSAGGGGAATGPGPRLESGFWILWKKVQMSAPTTVLAAPHDANAAVAPDPLAPPGGFERTWRGAFSRGRLFSCSILRHAGPAQPQQTIFFSAGLQPSWLQPSVFPRYRRAMRRRPSFRELRSCDPTAAA
jgi:hypothetical protein